MDIRDAEEGYKSFTGHEPSGAYIVPLDEGRVPAYAVGKVEAIAYEARRDGITEKYMHEFGKKSRPDLVVRADGRQMYLARGAYEFTDRGIEDVPAELMIINPSSRPSRRRRASSGRSKGKSIMRRNPSRRRRASTSHRRRRVSYRRNPVVSYAPRRRRRTRYRRNPIVHHRSHRVRRYRRNPSHGGRGFPNVAKMILPAAMIAGGAVATEFLMSLIPLPAVLTNGSMAYLTKAAVGVGLGALVGKTVSRRAGDAFVMGSLVIAAHDFMKATIAGMPVIGTPAVAAPGAGFYNPAMLGQHVQDFAGVDSYTDAFDGT